jgi:hypothetical protein
LQNEDTKVVQVRPLDIISQTSGLESP